MDAVRILLDAGADPNGVSQCDGSTSLHDAAEVNNARAAEALIAAGAETDVLDILDDTPLHTAAWYGKYEVAQVLLRHGADPNVKGPYGTTPLHTAVTYDKQSLVRLLIANGANVNATAENGLTPLGYCETRATADLLVTHGAKPTHPEDFALLGDAAKLQELVTAKPELVNDTNTFGQRTLLHWAVMSGSVEAVALLVSRGAKVNARDINGVTPLSLARERRYHDIAEVLVKHGAR